MSLSSGRDAPSIRGIGAPHDAAPERAGLHGSFADASSDSGADRGSAAVARAAELYQLALRRRLHLGAELSSDAAWHMLLDMFIAATRRRRLSVSAVCIGSLAPPSTGYRYLALLVERGLAHRAADPLDGRRSYVELTDDGRALMRRLLEKGAPDPAFERHRD